MKRETNDLVVRVRAGLLEEAAEARRLAARVRGLDFAPGDPPRRARDLEQALDTFAQALEAIGETLAAAREAPAALTGWENAREARNASWSALANAVEALGAALGNEQSGRSIDRMRLAEGMRLAAHGTAEAKSLTARVAELDREVHLRDGRLTGMQAEVDALRAESDRLASRVASLEGELGAARDEVRARDAGIAELRTEQARLIEERAGLAAEVARLGAIVSQDAHQFIIRLGALLEPYPRVRAFLRAGLRVPSWVVNKLRR